MARKSSKPKEKTEPLTVDRKIYFFRSSIGENADKSPIIFDPSKALETINALTFDAQGRYHVSSDGSETICIVDRNESPHRIKLGNVRRTDLPHQEERGVFSPLGIPAGTGLVEPIHVVFFPDNIIGCEFNFYGPRIGKLKTYLVAKGGDYCRDLSFTALLRQNVAEDLKKLRTIKAFQLKIFGSYAETLRQADNGLGSAFQAAREAGGAEVVEIILKPEKRSRTSKLADSLLSVVKRVTELPGIREQAKSFVVAGDDEVTGKRIPIDLLSDQLIAKKTILKSDPQSRAVNSESAYHAIEEAYAELKDQLVTVSGVLV